MEFKYLQDYSLRKLPLKTKTDEFGIPLFEGSQFGYKKTVYHPTVICQYALACYERKNNGFFEEFMKCSKWLLNNAKIIQNKPGLHWPIPFPLNSPKLDEGWSSALTQAQAISVLLRFYDISKDQKTKIVLDEAIKPLITDIKEGGLLFKKGSFIFLEEAGVIHILNGCLTSLYSLIEYNQLFFSAEVNKVIMGITMTLEKHLKDFDTKSWSKYSLGLRLNHSDLHYHNLHIKQLNEIGFILDNKVFLEYARKWQEYLDNQNILIFSLIKRKFYLTISRILTILKLSFLKNKEFNVWN